jgi:hypothetical protein
MKGRKPVNPETIRKRAANAIFVLRKSTIIALQQEWLTSETCSILGGHILQIDKIFMRELPPPVWTGAVRLSFFGRLGSEDSELRGIAFDTGFDVASKDR